MGWGQGRDTTGGRGHHGDSTALREGHHRNTMGAARDTIGTLTHPSGPAPPYAPPPPTCAPLPGPAPHPHCALLSQRCPKRGRRGLALWAWLIPPLKRRRTPRGWGPPRRGRGPFKRRRLPAANQRSAFGPCPYMDGDGGGGGSRAAYGAVAREGAWPHKGVATQRGVVGRGAWPSPGPREDPTRDSAPKPTSIPPSKARASKPSRPPQASPSPRRPPDTAKRRQDRPESAPSPPLAPRSPVLSPCRSHSRPRPPPGPAPLTGQVPGAAAPPLSPRRFRGGAVHMRRPPHSTRLRGAAVHDGTPSPPATCAHALRCSLTLRMRHVGRQLYACALRGILGVVVHNGSEGRSERPLHRPPLRPPPKGAHT